MRQISSFLALSLTALLGVNAFDTSIITFDRDHRHHDLKKSTLSDDAGRLLLERRMKSADSSVLGSFDDEAVKHLNQFGGKQSSLFGISERKGILRKSLVILEGIDAETLYPIQESYPNELVVSHSSIGFVDDGFLASLLEMNPENKADNKLCAFYSDNVIAEHEAFQAARGCLSQGPIFQEATPVFDRDLLAHVDSVESWVGKTSPVAVIRVRFKPHLAPKDVRLVTHLKSFLHNLAIIASGDKQQVTAVLSKDAQDPQQSNHSLRPRRDTKDEYLSKLLGATPDRKGSRVLPILREQVSMPSALMPVCHATNATCVETTSNCSGHGFCYKKYSSKDETAASDCFACKCHETLIRKEDGTIQKIRWGGSACQKRDVSSPFFLIAGITIMVTMAVITAVGMLYNVGQDELPSVIGAAVGPTRMQK